MTQVGKELSGPVQILDTGQLNLSFWNSKTCLKRPLKDRQNKEVA